MKNEISKGIYEPVSVIDFVKLAKEPFDKKKLAIEGQAKDMHPNIDKNRPEEDICDVYKFTIYEDANSTGKLIIGDSINMGDMEIGAVVDTNIRIPVIMRLKYEEHFQEFRNLISGTDNYAFWGFPKGVTIYVNATKLSHSNQYNSGLVTANYLKGKSLDGHGTRPVVLSVDAILLKLESEEKLFECDSLNGAISTIAYGAVHPNKTIL